MTGLRRAGFVVFSRRGGTAEAPAGPTPDIRRWYSGPVALSEHAPEGCLDAAGMKAEPSALVGTPVLAFCGIGGPEGFVAGVERTGMTLAGTAFYPDHHAYRSDDLSRIIGRAREVGAKALVTTEKDFVRLGKMAASLAMTIPLFRLRMRVHFLEGEERLQAALKKCFAVGRT